MVMRTPLGQVRGLGSAKKGTGDWIVSRVTSVALSVLYLAFLIIVVGLVGRSHAEVVDRLASPLVALVLLATLVLTTVHMRLGMQVIIEDYVHDELPKFALLIANTLFSWAVGLTAIFAVLKIAFGAGFA
jgi:succinate dehydrogenase / fumarate reductase membrane anchor subunit